MLILHISLGILSLLLAVITTVTYSLKLQYLFRLVSGGAITTGVMLLISPSGLTLASCTKLGLYLMLIIGADYRIKNSIKNRVTT